MNKLLLQCCCGPCATIAINRLKKELDIILFFSGSNIHPADEYKKRKAALLAVNDALNDSKEIIYDEYNPSAYMGAVSELLSEPEGGARCAVCIELRMRAAAEYANKHGYTHFASTLSTSPHKKPKLIDRIGKTLAKEYRLTYVATDFKSAGGFAESVQLSKSLGIYRQNYCGCEMSRRK
jgi:predicted adenine nucleotide alpha hydrolase (AANH) superfamily ATPase